MKELIECLEKTDQQLFLMINGWHSPAADAFFLAVSDARWWIPFFLWLLFALYKDYPGRNFFFMLVAVGVSVTLTDRLSVEAFKDVFLRYRPCYNSEIGSMVHLVKSSCGGKYGFVSSHAANYTGLAVLFYYLLRRSYRHIGWVMAIWALLIGYSRIYLGVHYPADVIGGMALGAVSGWSVWKGFYKVTG